MPLQVDQINTEYKVGNNSVRHRFYGFKKSLNLNQVLAMKYHPDKNNGDKDAEKKFQQLKEAKEILCEPEKRQMYDKWRNSGLQISYKNWMGMKEHVVSVNFEILSNALRDCEILSCSNNRCTGLIRRQKTACFLRLAEQAI